MALIVANSFLPFPIYFLRTLAGNRISLFFNETIWILMKFHESQRDKATLQVFSSRLELEKLLKSALAVSVKQIHHRRIHS